MPAPTITEPPTAPIREGPENDGPAFPPITVKHVQNCAFSSWYPTFASSTLKSRIIPLSEEFIEYLESDGVFLPLNGDGDHQPGYSSEEDSNITELPEDDTNNTTWKDEIRSKLNLQDDGLDFDSDTDDEEDTTQTPSFPQLQAQIEDAIEELGGAVFPKLNWSSPKDAAWIAVGSTLKCTMPADVFLLLKSSDFVAHDLSHAFEGCVSRSTSERNEDTDTRPEQYELVLRKWYDLVPSMEFRCFVKDGNLVAISQRDIANFYDFLLDIGEELKDRIIDFFDAKIKGRFADPNYVFDVYINQNNRKIWLVDFNPFSPKTDSLLYTWPEIIGISDPPHFRIIESQAGASGSAVPAYSTNRLPRDAIDLSNGASIEQFAEDFRRNLYDAVVD